MSKDHKPSVGELVAVAIESVGGAASLARRLGVTTQAVCFWRDGKRRFPEALGARMESVTGNRVTRQALFPKDWADIWPELADSEEKQPPPPAQQAPAAINSEVRSAA